MNNTTTNHNTPSRMMRLCAFALAHIVTLLPLTASAAGFGGETCGRYTYTIDENKAIIIGFDDYEYEGDLIITNQLDNYTVTGIGQSAFAYRSTLTSVTIPDTVTTIEYRAFANCASLTNLFIPNSVTNIDYGADHGVVQGSPLLIHITVADDNETYADIDGVLFDKACSTLLACPNGRAGAYAIPDGVTTIVAEALRYCTALTSITLPDSLRPSQDAFEYARPSPTSPWQRTTRTMPRRRCAVRQRSYHIADMSRRFLRLRRPRRRDRYRRLGFP